MAEQYPPPDHLITRKPSISYTPATLRMASMNVVHPRDEWLLRVRGGDSLRECTTGRGMMVEGPVDGRWQ